MNIDSDSIEQKYIEQRQINPWIKRGWLRALLYLVASVIMVISVSVLVFIAAFVLDSVSPESVEKYLIPGNLVFTLSYIAALLAVLFVTWIFRRFIDRRPFSSLGFSLKGYTKDCLYGMLWGAGMIVAGFVPLYFTGYISIVKYQFNAYAIINSFILFIVVALNEEIMIRGYILTNLMDSMNKYSALVVSAIVFFLMHVTNPGMSIMPAINLFLAGLVLGIYYIHKRNLWFPIGMHLTWNFCQGPLCGFEVSGNNIEGILKLKTHGSELVHGGVFGFEGSVLATIFIIAITIILHYQYKTEEKEVVPEPEAPAAEVEIDPPEMDLLDPE